MKFNWTVAKIVKIVTLLLVLINLFLASKFVLNGDLYFNTDIARDFLLFSEIDQKKIILIGPRTSAGGLFHGPLWLYLNYPAYLFGNGNPIIVGWFWILLIAAFSVVNFFVVKKLFSEKTALIYTLIVSVYLVSDAKGLLNPYGAFFILPAWFLFLILYQQTGKFLYLAVHFFLAGLVIQFQMAVGVPLFILSLFYVTLLIIKRRSFKHFLAFGFIFLALLNFIAFDVRHEFIQAKALVRNLLPESGNPKLTYGAIFSERLDFFTRLPAAKDSLPWQDRFYFLLLISLSLVQIRNNRFKNIYLTFFYFYFGYFLISLSQKHLILTHQFLPIISLGFLIFSSLATSKYSKLFLLLLLWIYASNFLYALNYVKNSEKHFGQDEDSWKFLLTFSRKVYEFQDKEFGYFIYSPDVVGYEPRYAMFYAGRLSGGKAHFFQKEPVTYLVIAPPPPDNPYMRDEWWRKNQIRIDKEPTLTLKFPNGYKIEKYLLSEEETKVLPDERVNPGLHFR